MYVGNTLGSYGGLSDAWGFGDTKPSIVDPKQYIPQKHDILNADQASLYLKRPGDRKPPATKNTKGGVYWTNTGPQFSNKKIKIGKKAEKVPAPKIKFRPNVEVVRDLPKLDLAPVPGQTPPKEAPKTKAKAKAAAKTKPLAGFADAKKGSILPLLILGLVIMGLVRYNKS